mmetsp:Transcript_2178/g.6895  ORF Transcript_2178/g.6895 Transcript_2178/m.6895 type:complete len:279 (-) Transcript_2178:834-1670(-)
MADIYAAAPNRGKSQQNENVYSAAPSRRGMQDGGANNIYAPARSHSTDPVGIYAPANRGITTGSSSIYAPANRGVASDGASAMYAPAHAGGPPAPGTSASPAALAGALKPPPFGGVTRMTPAPVAHASSASFGSSSQGRTEDELLFEMSTYPFYRPQGSRASAEAELSTCSPKTFIVRPSTQESSFALSVVTDVGGVDHNIIRFESGGWRMKVGGVITRGYDTVEELLRSLPHYVTFPSDYQVLPGGTNGGPASPPVGSTYQAMGAPQKPGKTSLDFY